MPLKNSDGSFYRLKSPNPLVNNQRWMDDKMVLHNMKWKNETIIPAKIDEIQEEEIIIPEPLIETVTPQIIVEEKPIEAPSKKRESLSNILLIHCLPAILKEKKDEMYGESYFTVEYGEKFIFEAIVVSRGDLVFEFWTTKELTPRSILYPSRYADNQRFNDFRWWKVNEIEPKSDGWLIQAVFSDYQPDFT